MSQNDVLALDAIISESRSHRAPNLNEADYFELFTAAQALKDFEPTDEEVEAGQVGGGDDGGLDALYFLINRRFVADDTEIDTKILHRVDLILIQATREQSFTEKRIVNLNLITEDLLDLSKTVNNLSGTYNSDVLTSMNRFKEKYRPISHLPHEFTIRYIYVSKGDTRLLNAALKKQSERVREKASYYFREATVEFDFIGAAELVTLARQSSKQYFPLTMDAAPISPLRQNAWIALVPIVEFYAFITDDNHQLRESFFESNVRDWLGDHGVNEAIKESLERSVSNEDFWWLNNGVTILADSASSQGGNILSVGNPQIVNGLQTSRAIFNFMHSIDNQSAETEERRVLVRVIVPREPDSIDHIIEATNNQTQVPAFSLHMTKKIHRDIEDYLRKFNLCYDRRKNYYKNQGEEIARIVPPSRLAQALIAIMLQRPDEARARPTTVLNTRHDDVFSQKFTLNLYSSAALLLRAVDKYLSSPDVVATRNVRTNLRWYLAMEYSIALTGEPTPKMSDIANMIMPDDFSLLADCYNAVLAAYDALGATDQVAKGPDLRNRLLETHPRSIASRT